MRITRLEIFGFKSFRDRFVLNFDKDVISVVGPNGCGKSNIVDALRWVLGETHAKQLRGSLLEDLIFNGSESHRPLGMAEVTITIRPDENWRSTSLVNQPLTGLLHNPVGGDARQNGSQESKELDDISDEALGEVSHAEEERAEEALATVPSSLLEIPGLFDAAEIQLTRRMYRSGESEYFINRVPCRLRDMTDLYRLIGLGARGLSIVQQGQIGEIISKKPIERRELLEEAAGISGFRARMESAHRRLEKTYENMNRLADIIAEVEKQVRSLRRQAQRAKTRQELKDRLKAVEVKLFRAKAARVLLGRREDRATLGTLEDSLNKRRSELALAAARDQENRAQLEELDVELVRLRRQRDELAGKIDEERTKESDLRVRLAQIEGRSRALRDELLRNDKRKEEIHGELEQLSREMTEAGVLLEQLESKKLQSERSLGDFQSRQRRDAQSAGTEHHEPEMRALVSRLEFLPQLQSVISALEADQRKVAARLHQHRNEIQQKRVAMATLQGEIESLQEQLRSLAEHVVKNTSGAKRATGTLGAEEQVLLAGLKVPSGLQKIVSALLGEKLTYLVSESPTLLAKAYAARESAGAKNVQVGVLERGMLARTPIVLTERHHQAAPSARLLLPEIQIAPRVEAVAQWFLGNVCVVDDLLQATKLASQFKEEGNHDAVIATLDGALVGAWGWCTFEGEGASLAMRERLEKQSSRRNTVQGELQSLEAATGAIEKELRELEDKLKEKFQERDSLTEEQSRLAEMLREEQRREDARRHELLQEERRIQETVRELTGEVAAARGALEFRTRRHGELLREQASLVERSGSLTQEEAQAQGQERELLEMLQRKAEHASEEQDERSKHSLQTQLLTIEGYIREIESQRGKLKLVSGEVNQELSESRHALDQLTQKQNESKLRAERADIELQLLLDDARRTYGDGCALPAEDELESLIHEDNDDAGEVALQEASADLRRRLEREGEVDSSSIEQYETENSRLEEMKKQYSDLDAASKILERTIRQLKEISKARFIETFEAVSKKFSELVPRLFGGGAGRMELVNPEDVLTSGVELVVRPPGKNLRTLDLMSGGEKALAATAILMAMFLHRPSPVCVLDEVDAPLDDVNLGRFLNLIREIAASTQFLVITHNKLTMAAADRLIGITMQEKGVSTALAVSFEQAEREFAQVVNA